MVFSGDLLFAGIVMASYLQQQTLTWNIVSTEEGRYEYIHVPTFTLTNRVLYDILKFMQLLHLGHMVTI